MTRSRARTTAVPDRTAIEDFVPEATPASSDLICWLWAAFPPAPRGGVNVARVAERFGVSVSTVRRWLRDPDYEMTRDQRILLGRRAILRGRGHYPWPPADAVTLNRSASAIRYAEAALADLVASGPSQRAKQTSVNVSHDVFQVHYPHAHVYGLVVSRSEDSKHIRKVVRNGGEVLDHIMVPNKHAATLVKENALAGLGPARCLAPRELVPTGRTETWRETAGVVDLKQYVPASLKHGDREKSTPADERGELF